MSLEIRRILPEEYAAAGAVTEAAYDEFTTGPHDSYRVLLRDTATRDREAEVWVAVEGGRVLGNVTIAPLGSAWREIGTDDEGEFRMLAVDPAGRGRGVGRALLESTLARFRDEGFAGVALSSLETMTAAHSLYRRAGFVRDPGRDWSPKPGVELIAFALRF